MMKKQFENLRDQGEHGLRRVCGKISPDRRATVVLVLLAAFAALNLWVTGKAIWSIGREDNPPRLITIPQIETPDFVPEQESVIPFEQSLNTENHDTTTVEQAQTGR